MNSKNDIFWSSDSNPLNCLGILSHSRQVLYVLDIYVYVLLFDLDATASLILTRIFAPYL